MGSDGARGAAGVAWENENTATSERWHCTQRLPTATDITDKLLTLFGASRCLRPD